MGGGGSKTAPEGENDEDELPKETEDDKKDPNNKPLDVGKDFGGPCKKRKCEVLGDLLAQLRVPRAIRAAARIILVAGVQC